MPQGGKPGKRKAETKRSVGRKSPKSDAPGRRELEKHLAEALEQLQARNHELAEAQEQQTATSEILRTIAHAQTDAQPVFDTIVRSAARLCHAVMASVLLTDGQTLYLPANYGSSPEALAAVRARFPRPLDRESASGAAILTRSIVHVPDVLEPSVVEFTRQAGQVLGYRSLVTVPMLREGRVVGAISVCRREPGRFSDAEVALLQTFADQAVIAIENVRLFNETKEALEQQTATAEILRVISQSPTAIQPVLDAVTTNAAAVCGATDALIMRVEGQDLRRVAHFGPIPLVLPALRPLTQGSAAGRAILECRTIHVHDILAADTARDYPETLPADAGPIWRTVLAVPLVRDGVAIGAILIRRTEIRPFTAKEIQLLETFASQAVIAIENVRLFKELEEKNRALTESHAQVTEALDQQTATADILRVISQSPTELQPVLDALVKSAVRFCGADDSLIHRLEGDRLPCVAHHGPIPAQLGHVAPVVGTTAGRCVLDRRAIHVADLQVETEEFPEGSAIAREFSYHTILSVPLLREGVPLGAIILRRTAVEPFSDKQIALLHTFADQAVIAIENVRLFTELQASNRGLTTALDQQTATSEILRVIASSPTDLQPVLDAVAERAARLCSANDAVIFRVENGAAVTAAIYGGVPAIPVPLIAGTMLGRAVLGRQLVHIDDMTSPAAIVEFPDAHVARARGTRTMLAAPLLREGEAIGVILIRRYHVQPFTEQQVGLLQTFADQAVIAIENVRLFTELQASNRDLTTALDQQTATSDILRVISQSQTDVQPVFDAIVSSAVRLLGAYGSVLTRLADEAIVLAAFTSTGEAGDAALRAQFPESLRSRGAHATIIRDRVQINSADAPNDPRLLEATRNAARARGFRSLVGVPLLHHEEAIGAITVSRREPGGFTDDEIALLQTFADQAVIAIENVRLFKELEARTRELTQSVEQLTALGEISRAVSSTLDVETVLDTIVSRASQLAGADGCAIYEYDDATEAFHIRATHNLDPVLVETLRAAPLRKGEGTMGRAAETREPTQVADIAAPGAYQSHIRETLLGAGYRALLSVPLLREGEIIGSLSLNRHTPGDFPPEAVEVLKTFATQSALAIQNARLFREIADKSAQLEAASRHKSEFLANMSHELRTPLNAIIGFSEILAERMFGDINEKQTEYLQDILESGRHLLSLINDILDLSKIEAGRMELELAEFDLPSAIENALILVRERASRRGIRLGSTVDERLGMIGGDERKVKQVLLNLLSNALKFTPEGGRIDVGARLDGDMVEVSVTDTGIGIAPADQEAVFEEFRQVGTADKKAEGTGLGLALSRKFIELHGGQIWVKSQLGAGSTFTFTLLLRR